MALVLCGGVVVEVIVALGVVDGVGVTIDVWVVVGVPEAVGDGTSLDVTAIADTIIEVNDVVGNTDAAATAATATADVDADVDVDAVVGADEEACIKGAIVTSSSSFVDNSVNDGKTVDKGPMIIEPVEDCVVVCELDVDALASTKDDSRLRSSSLPNSSSSLV